MVNSNQSKAQQKNTYLYRQSLSVLSKSSKNKNEDENKRSADVKDTLMFPLSKESRGILAKAHTTQLEEGKESQ